MPLSVAFPLAASLRYTALLLVLFIGLGSVLPVVVHAAAYPMPGRFAKESARKVPAAKPWMNPPQSGGLQPAADLDPINSVPVLQNTLLRLHEAYQTLSEENATLKRNYELLRKAIQDTEAAQQSLENRLGQDTTVLREQLRVKEEALQASQTQVKQLKEQLTKLEQKPTTGATLAEKQAALNETQVALAASQQKEQQHLKELQETRQQLEQLALRQQEQQQEKQALEAKLQQAAEELAKREQALTESRAELIALRKAQSDTAQASQSQKVATLSQQLQALQEEKSALQQNLSATEAQLRQSQQALNEQKTALEQALQQQQAQAESVALKQGTMKEAQGQLEQLNKELAASQEKQRQFESQIAALGSTLEQRNAAVEQLQQELAKAKQSLATRPAEASATETPKESTAALSQSDYASLMQRLQESRQGLAEAVATINQQNERISSLNTKIKDLQSQVFVTEEAPVKQQASTSSAELVALQKENQSLKEKWTAAAKELSELRGQVSSQSASSTVTQEKLLAYEQLKAQVASLNQALEAANQKLATQGKSPATATNPTGTGTANAAEVFAMLSQAVEAEQKGETKKALSLLEKAESLGASSPPFALLKAKILNQLDQDAAVIQILEPLSQRYPGVYPEAYHILAKAYIRQNQLDKAERAYLGALPLDVLSNYASLLKRTNRLDQAETILNTALSIKPDDPILHYNLGNLYATWQRWPEAKSEYQQALKLNPSMSKAVYNLALLEVNTKEPEAARAHLEQYLQMEPNASNAAQVKQFIQSLGKQK